MEKEAGQRMRRNYRQVEKGECCWLTSGGPPWCSAVCLVWSPSRGVSWAECVQQGNWESWSKEMCSEESYFLGKQR